MLLLSSRSILLGGDLGINSWVLPIFELFFQKLTLSRRDGPCSQSVSQSVSGVCLYLTPIRFEVLSEPMKLQFIKGK